MSSEFERNQYRKRGLDSAPVKARYRRFLRSKYLSEEEIDFSKWARARGHELADTAEVKTQSEIA